MRLFRKYIYVGVKQAKYPNLSVAHLKWAKLGVGVCGGGGCKELFRKMPYALLKTHSAKFRSANQYVQQFSNSFRSLVDTLFNLKIQLQIPTFPKLAIAVSGNIFNLKSPRLVHIENSLGGKLELPFQSQVVTFLCERHYHC